MKHSGQITGLLCWNRSNMKKAFEKFDYAQKRWFILAICWPLLCLVFAAIIICQPGREGEEQIADIGFTLLPLIFFAIGMRIQYRLLKERKNAVVLTVATVISVENRVMIGRGNKRIYRPEFEFQVGGTTYRVKSPSGFGRSYVKKGEQVELYYAADNPHVFYVPVMQRHDKRWAMLLCGVGMLYPLVGLFAPQIREIFAFLE